MLLLCEVFFDADEKRVLMRTWNARLCLDLEMLALLLKAVWVRRRGGASLRLPPVAEVQIPLEAKEKLIVRVNRITSFFAGQNRHACWYRCYPLAVLLRRRGLAVQLNIGLMGFGAEQKQSGHCWLTLDGTVFNELESISSASYPDFLGENGYGVAFWVKAGQGSYVSRRVGQ